jgi:hypothetical protein
MFRRRSGIYRDEHRGVLYLCNHSLVNTGKHKAKYPSITPDLSIGQPIPVTVQLLWSKRSALCKGSRVPFWDTLSLRDGQGTPGSTGWVFWTMSAKGKQDGARVSTSCLVSHSSISSLVALTVPFRHSPIQDIVVLGFRNCISTVFDSEQHCVCIVNNNSMSVLGLGLKWSRSL